MSERSTADQYSERGFGNVQGMGSKPALVVVDFSNGFTSPDSPLHCESGDALAATARLLDAFRERGDPVVFTTIGFDEGGRQVARHYLAKVPSMEMLAPGSRWVEIDERVAPLEDEPVLWKLFASAFFGTPLATLLASAGCDTVIVTGASTSGCVRATALDALQHGYGVIVPRDAVADRLPSAHEASLADIDAKYGDVVGVDELLEMLAAVPAASARAGG